MPSSFKALCAIRQNVIFSYFSLRCFLLCIFFSDNFTEEQLIVKNPMTFSKLTMASITLNERPQKRWIHLFWRSRAKDRNLMKMFGDPDPMFHETKSLIICWIQLMMTFWSKRPEKRAVGFQGVHINSMSLSDQWTFIQASQAWPQNLRWVFHIALLRYFMSKVMVRTIILIEWHVIIIISEKKWNMQSSKNTTLYLLFCNQFLSFL